MTVPDFCSGTRTGTNFRHQFFLVPVLGCHTLGHDINSLIEGYLVENRKMMSSGNPSNDQEMQRRTMCMIMQSGWQTGNGVWELTLLCLVRTLEMRVTKQLWKITIA